MALVFTLAGLVGVLVTILAFNSRQYRDLSAAYARRTGRRRAALGENDTGPIG